MGAMEWDIRSFFFYFWKHSFALGKIITLKKQVLRSNFVFRNGEKIKIYKWLKFSFYAFTGIRLFTSNSYKNNKLLILM